MGMGHQVGHTQIGFMANACEDGHRGMCDDAAQVELVEGVQIQCGTTASHHDHGVGLPLLGLGEGLHQFSRGSFSLHRGLEDFYLEPHAPLVLNQMGRKVSEP